MDVYQILVNFENANPSVCKAKRKYVLNPNKKFQCKFKMCKQVFQTFLERKKHYLVHLKTVRCKEIDCEKEFTSFEDRKKHYKNNHFKFYPCLICKAKLRRGENRTNHEARCKKSFSSVKIL